MLPDKVHPIERLGPAQRRLLFRITVGATLMVMATLGWVDGYLRSNVSPQGIVSFEFAWSLEGARFITRRWDERAKAFAGFSLGLDYLFLLLYSTSIASALLLRAAPTRWRRRLAWGQWLAALLDAVENACLLALLGGAASDMAAKVAAVCAAFKFALVLMGIAEGVRVLCAAAPRRAD